MLPTAPLSLGARIGATVICHQRHGYATVICHQRHGYGTARLWHGYPTVIKLVFLIDQFARDWAQTPVSFGLYKIEPLCNIDLTLAS